MEKAIRTIKELAVLEYGISQVQVGQLIKSIGVLFRLLMLGAGHNARQITRITTKFRDAGRRSAPWRPTSSRVPGRPQDGADGNRISRWLLPEDHKFYANEITATLVEIKYYLQALSMEGAPELPDPSLKNIFSWLLEHPLEPNRYLDPIQLIQISLPAVVDNARIIQSGHLIPLDRNGKHEPQNAFLMLARSNQLQGNLTLEELLVLMEAILARHKDEKIKLKAAH